jgi:hypothetical protein
MKSQFVICIAFLISPLLHAQTTPVLKSIATNQVVAPVDISPATTVSSGSTALRQLADRFSEVFNVKDFGATGSGSIDDTIAIQATINAAAAAGNATVYFPQGSYLVSSSLTLPGNYQGQLSVVGSGMYSSLILGGSNAIDIFSFAFGTASALECITIRDLGFGVAATKVPNSAIRLTNTSALRLSRIWIAGSNSSEGGIPGQGYVNGIILDGAWWAQIDTILINGNEASYDGGTGAGTGSGILLVHNCVNNLFSKIQMMWFKKGITVDPLDLGFTAQGNTFSDIIMYQTDYGFYIPGGIVWTEAYQLSNILIDNGNKPAQTAEYAIYAVNVGDLEASHIYAICNGTSPTAISLVMCNQVNISGSHIISLGGGGRAIDFEAASCHAVVTGNSFRGYTTDVYVASSCSGIVVNNNQDAATPNGTGQATTIDLTAPISKDVVGDVRGFTWCQYISGGAATETHYFDISSCGLAQKPDGVSVHVTSDQANDCQYNWEDLGNSSSQIALRFFRRDGAILGTCYVRVSVVVSPPVR